MQYQREVAPAAEVRRRSVHDARGDVQIHRSHAARQGVSIQPDDGGEVGDHVTFGATADPPGLSGDPRAGLERPRPRDESRGQCGWRADLATGSSSGSDPAEMPHALSMAMAMERARGDLAKPLYR